MLEENYCFDAEVYADELELSEELVFRDDQRSEFHYAILPSVDILTSLHYSQPWKMGVTQSFRCITRRRNQA